MAIISKILRKTKIINIDVFLYEATEKTLKFNTDIEYQVIHKSENGLESYWVYDEGNVVHKSFIFKNVHLLSLLNRSGITIGNCYTNPEYRGQSIYPKIISYIYKEKKQQTLMIVDSNNISSIKGIEKAGFKRIAHIKTKRWLIFYFNKEIRMY